MKKVRRFITGTFHSNKMNSDMNYRSSWELRYMEWLEENEDVIAYEYESMVIPYISNIRTSRVRKYFPDFYVIYADGRSFIVEIKPTRFLSRQTIKKKIAAGHDYALDHGHEYVVLTETDLKQLGILL
jgi:hypothetical protein